MKDKIHAGFGTAGYFQDGIWKERENIVSKTGNIPTMQDIEDIAAKAPDNDWRIFFFDALITTEYRRIKKETWVLVKIEEGFA